MKLPRKVKKGEAVRAEDFNALIDCLKSVALMPGPGYRRKVSEAGTVLNITRRSSWRDESEDFAPFAVREVTLTNDGGDPPEDGYNVRLEPGRVVSINPAAAGNGANGLDYHIPEIGGEAMDALDENGDLPEIFVPFNSYLYCKIQRTGEGVLTGTSEIVVEDAEVTDSAHYQPGEADGAGDPEEYQMVKLCQFVPDVENGNAATIKYWRKSDIEVGPHLQQCKNIGGDGTDIYKRWNKEEQRLEFYRVWGEYGIDDTLEEDKVRLRFDAENVGQDQTAYVTDVWIEPDYDDDDIGVQPAQFRTIGQGETADEREIRITEDNDLIRIHGNGVKRKITFVDCDANTVAEFQFIDGLLTGAGDVALTLGNCGTTGP